MQPISNPWISTVWNRLLQKKDRMRYFRIWEDSPDLNLCSELYKEGILDKYNVRVIGSSIESIKEGEDRDSLKS